MREIKELKIKASDESMPAVNEFVHSVLPAKIDEMVLNQIDLALEEVFVNIAHYSGAAEAELLCSFEYGGDDKGVLEVTFCDSGVRFDPLEKPDPDLTLSAEERNIGGLGIFLTKKFMDSVEYEYSGGMNRLKIRKQIFI